MTDKKYIRVSADVSLDFCKKEFLAHEYRLVTRLAEQSLGANQFVRTALRVVQEEMGTAHTTEDVSKVMVKWAGMTIYEFLRTL